MREEGRLAGCRPGPARNQVVALLTALLSLVGLFLVVVPSTTCKTHGCGRWMACTTTRPSYPFEPNDDISQAASIEPGYYTHFYAQNEDWYSFSVDYAEFIDVSIYFLHGDGNLQLELYGVTQNYLAGSYSTNNEERVTFTSIDSGNFYVRIFNAEIEYALLLTVKGWIYDLKNPGSNVKWFVDDVKDITWNSTLNVRNVDIELRKSNVPHATIARSVSNTRSYRWTIPANLTTGNDYQVRVSDSANPGVQVTSAFFTINATKAIRFLNPASGSTFFTNKLHAITWYTTGIIHAVNITLIKNQTSIRGIVQNLTNSGTYQWRVPIELVAGTDYQLMISDFSNACWNFTSIAFTIDDTKTLTIVTPNTGTHWHVGVTYQITWDWTGPVQNVDVSLLRGEQAVAAIATSIENTGAFAWAVSFSLATGYDYRVRVADASAPSIGSTSDVILVNATRTITINNPGQSTTWYTATPVVITWVSTGAISTVDVLLLRAGSLLLVLASDTPNTGFMRWWVPATLTGNLSTYQVRVRDHDDPAGIKGTSPWFNVDDARAITIDTPDRARIGAVRPITWSTTGDVGRVDVSLWRNSSFAAWICRGTTNDGTYRWLVPGDTTPGLGYAVQVVDSDRPTAVTARSGSFEIVEAAPARRSYGVAAGNVLTWTAGFNVFLDLPDAAWEKINAEIGPSGSKMDARRLFESLVEEKPNSWHVQARVKGLASNDLLDGEDHVFSDISIKENVERDYRPLGLALQSTVQDDGVFDFLAANFDLPHAIGEDAGNNVDINSWRRIHLPIPSSPLTATFPGFVIPSGTTLGGIHDWLVANISANAAFNGLFGSWEQFALLSRWREVTGERSLDLEFDILPVLRYLRTNTSLGTLPLIGDLLVQVDGLPLDLGLEAVVCNLAVAYDTAGILDKIEFEMHARGTVAVGTGSSDPFDVYFEYRVYQGELPSITFKHVPFKSAVGWTAFPLTAAAGCLLMGLMLVVRRRHLGRTRVQIV